jgi:stage III sporulation protein AD
MAVIKIAVIGMSGMVLSVMLKNVRAEYAVLIGLATTVVLFYFILTRLGLILDDVSELMELIGVDERYFGILVKMTGITYLTEMAAGICRDGGCQSIATQIEMFGKLSIMGIGMSVIVMLMNTILTGL